jgi:hypothetical protein
MDLGKRWFAVKPIEPRGPMFYEFQSISSRLVNGPGDNIYDAIVKRVSTGESIAITEVHPKHFATYLDPEDDGVPFPPKAEALKIQILAEKKLDEILASPFVTHAVTKMLVTSLKEKGDPFDLNDLQYIDSLHEIMLDKAGVKHDESD